MSIHEAMRNIIHRSHLPRLLKSAAVSGAVSLSCALPLAGEEDLTTKPDPATHTVIVPFDAKKPIDLPKADRFYLDYADFQRLWALAKENRRPEKVETDTGASEAAILSALYESEVLDANLRLKARFSVHTRGRKWAKLALPFASKAGTLAVGEVTLDGHAAVVESGTVLIEEPGAHTVDVTLDVKLDRAWKNVALILPPASAGLLSLTVPVTDGRPMFAGPLDAAVSEENRGGRRTFTLPLGGATSIDVTRTSSRRLVAEVPPAQAETKAELSILPRMERLTGQVQFGFAGTERTSVSVELDPTLRLESASSTPAGITTLRKEGDKQFLDVNFSRAVADSAQVHFAAVRTFGEADAIGKRQSPVVRAVASRDSVVLELLAADELQVKADAPASLVRVASPQRPQSSALPVGAWRLEAGVPLPYTVGAAENRSKAQLEALYQISRQKAEIIAALTLDSGRAALQETSLSLPAGYEVQTVKGPRVVAWHRDGNTLRVRFDEQPQREARFAVHLAKTLAQPADAWTLEPLGLPQFAKQETTVLIAAHAADEVKLSFDAADRKMREVDPGTLSTAISVKAPMQMKRALRVEKPAWSAQVTLARQAPRFSVDAVLLAQASESGLHLSQRVGVNVEQGAFAAVKLRLPADLPEARVHGPTVRDTQSRLVNGVREYDVSFQAEALDRADFTLDLDLPLEGSKLLPVLQVEGASRTQRFVIVDNGSAREMKLEAVGAVSAAKENVPWLPDGLTRPQFFRAPDQGAIRVDFTQLDSTAGNAAIITQAEITTALRPSGERWEVVVYSLANRSLQFLPVRLPDRAELVEVSVGGQSVRADRAGTRSAESGNRNPEFLVPLIQMRAGELSQEVRLVYRVSALDAGVETTHALDDPELIGLSAERTLWNVWVPEGYEARDFDGNMDEVGEEGHELEKQRSLLSEVARLNRVLSSKEVAYEDAKMAWDNANKTIEQLKSRGAVRKSKVSSAPAQDRAVNKKRNIKIIEADVEKQIMEQDVLITGNSGNLRQLESKGKDSGPQGLVKSGTNTWVLNGTSQQQAGNDVSNQPATLFNDTAGVSNGFFDKDASTLSKSGTGNLVMNGGVLAFDASQQKPDAAALGNLSNARGNVQMAQQAQMGQTLSVGSNVTAGGGVTVQGGGTLTISGVNTYSGATIINGGTLAVGGNGLQMLDQAKNLAKEGHYTESRQLALAAANAGAGSSAVVLMEQLDDRARYQPVPSAGGAGGLPEVERRLQLGYSLQSLGDLEKAAAEFKGVLSLDAGNEGARRALERVEGQKREQAGTTRDQERARMSGEASQQIIATRPATPATVPPAPAPMAAADPFAPPAIAALVPRPAEQPVAAHRAAGGGVAGGFNNAGLGTGDDLGITQQLKPVGRVSLAIEVPLSGSVFHFSKLKDHAALEVTVVKPWGPEVKVAWWALLGGIVVFSGVTWRRGRR